MNGSTDGLMETKKTVTGGSVKKDTDEEQEEVALRRGRRKGGQRTDSYTLLPPLIQRKNRIYKCRQCGAVSTTVNTTDLTDVPVQY